MTEDMLALSVPIVTIIVIGLVTWAYLHFRYKSRARAQETIQAALEKGQELTPELLDRMAGPQPRKDGDLRRGLVSIAIGAAFALFGVILGEQEAIGPLIGVGAFPFLVGVAYLVMWRLGKNQS